MAKQNINVGTAANDKKGDSLRAAFQKVNTNFTELYAALGLDADTLNIGAFEFTGSTMSTTDSTAIIIDQAATITSNLSVGGDILPQTALGGDLGSSTLPWRSLYVSNNTIYIGGTAVGIDANGNLTTNGTTVGGGGSTLVNGANTVSLGSTGILTLPNGAVIKENAGDAVAFGQGAGETSQGNYAVAIGSSAGNEGQGGSAVAIGNSAGTTSQGASAVAVGLYAGYNTQGNGAVAVGLYAGYDAQGLQAVAIGTNAGSNTQGNTAVAIGNDAGGTSQGNGAVAVGLYAGYDAQGLQAVAVGTGAGLITQGDAAVAIGNDAGGTSQGDYAVAVGLNAGYNTQGNGAVAIGYNAGLITQGNYAVAIGLYAGETTQGASAVAVGQSAGVTSQGANAVAIGYQAGMTNQGNNSIILNATGSALDQTTANTFTVKPVRQGETANAMYYNSSTGEITYAGAFSFSVAADDSTQRAISNNESIKFIGAGGVTTASDAEGNITITGSSIPAVVTTGAVGVGGQAHVKVQFTVASATTVTAVGVTVIGISNPASGQITLSGSPATGSFNIIAATNVNAQTFILMPFATNASGTGYGAPIAGTGTDPCYVRGTLITMADMSRVAVENITYHDDILVWDFDLGEFASAKPLWIKKTQTTVVSCLLTFSDHSILQIVGDSPKAHRIFNKEAGKFTYGSMPETPIGTTTFNDQGEEITLISKQWIVGEVEFYNVMTDYHMNLFANSILTSMRYNNLYPITDMKFVKDGRTLRTADDYPNVEERLYKGFRLAEQTQSVEEIETHIQWLLTLEVERETECV